MDIFVSLPAQQLLLYERGILLRCYSVSTALNGPGENNGSYCTPRGHHQIRAKIGAACPENTVFVRRRATGEVWTAELAARFPGRDWMLTRIMWLSGLEPGFNRLGCVDTMRRYIYLHGSPDSVQMGAPGSIGCIRMRNRDIVELFDLVPVGTAVNVGDYYINSGNWTDMSTLARALRHEVFVVEQGVPEELEWDEFDPSSAHALALDAGGSVVGTGRLLADGHIGRMAVAAAWRGKGVGAALLRHLIELGRRQGMTRLVLNAQTHAVPFYTRYGFCPEGEEYFEAGIPHLTMVQAFPA